MTKSETGYYGCKLPPGACHCPQDRRHKCEHAHWVEPDQLQTREQMLRALGEVRENEIIQIAPPHKWGGCLAVVSEVKSFGCQAYVSIPHNDETPPGHAYIRLSWEDFERVGADVIFAPADHVDT